MYKFSQKTATFAKTFGIMRVLIINTSERIGGAAVAASRLMEALKNNGIKAKMLVRDKQTDQISVVGLDRNWLTVWKFIWERIVIWKANHFKKNNLFAVDIANTGTDITNLPEFKQADVIHLHWINQGMISLKNLRKILESARDLLFEGCLARRMGKTHRMDYARHVAFDRHLSSCTRMYTLPAGVSSMPFPIWGRKQKGLVQPGI